MLSQHQASLCRKERSGLGKSSWNFEGFVAASAASIEERFLTPKTPLGLRLNDICEEVELPGKLGAGRAT
jgi:hypothetical protein